MKKMKRVAGMAILVILAAAGAPGEASAGCISDAMLCLEQMMSQDGLLDKIVGADLCQRTYMECVRIKLLGF
jgi:hypothetical protein